MFRVTTLDPAQVPRGEDGVDYSEDFFGKPTFLTVSGQLEAEIFALALTDVYTFGPTFRAENSNTSVIWRSFGWLSRRWRFATWLVWPTWRRNSSNSYLAYILENCAEDLEFFNQWYDKTAISTLESIVNSSFERLTYSEAIDILAKSGEAFEFPVEWGLDLQSEHERYITERVVQKPVVVTDYPKEIKAFYMRLNADGKTVGAMDVLVPRIGEIIGGSQREERYDVLLERLRQSGLDEENYWWYLDLRRYGTVPHSGFGLGFERTVQFITGCKHSGRHPLPPNPQECRVLSRESGVALPRVPIRNRLSDP